jgi:hypothetical protein
MERKLAAMKIEMEVICFGGLGETPLLYCFSMFLSPIQFA